MHQRILIQRSGQAEGTECLLQKIKSQSASILKGNNNNNNNNNNSNNNEQRYENAVTHTTIICKSEELNL
jgi:hypothetical protein